MKLLVVVLNANDKLEEVLEGLIEAGVTGATVVDSVGMGSIIEDVPLFAGLRSLFRGAKPRNNMLFSVIRDDQVEEAMDILGKILGCVRGERGKGLAIVGLATVAVSTTLYGPHWLSAASPLSNQLRAASNTSIPFYVQKWLSVPQYRVAQLLTGLFAIAYVLLVREAWRGRARLGLTAGLFCLSLSWLPSWYVAWPVSLAAVEEDRAAQWLALSLTAWLLRDAIAWP